MRGIVNKGKSFVSTIVLMALINTNANPKMWQVALVGILMYEGILLLLNTWQEVTRKRRERTNIAAGRADMKRVENEQFVWKMKEVS